MIHKLNIFMLKDTPVWDIEHDFLLLSALSKRGGVLFWCRTGEWRAIGGPRLETVVADLQRHRDIRETFIVADLVHMAPDQAYAHDEWDAAIPVPAELVRWLRDEAEQLGETDTTTESTPK